jgi:ribose-phosphate pyrophosphokinase
MIKINNQQVEFFKFPSGEMGIKKYPNPLPSIVEVKALLKSSDDIMSLFLVLQKLKETFIKVKFLEIPYIPFGRQDRPTDDNPNSLKMFSTILNNFLDKETIVKTVSPHSDVTRALINNIYSLEIENIIKDKEVYLEINKSKTNVLISPDAGFLKTANKIMKLGIFQEMVVCQKQRCTKTGDILKTIVEGDFFQKDIYIFDDICDGGRTFIEIAKAIKDQSPTKRPNKQVLFVAHGIFSKGLDVLRPHFDKVVCFQNYLTEEETDEEYLTTINKHF